MDGSLYERLGGVDAITAVVRAVVDRQMKDDRINQKSARTNVDRLRQKSVRLRCTQNLLSRRTCYVWRMQATLSPPGSRCSPRSITTSGCSVPRLSAR